MPVYEFVCDNCNANRELILPISEVNLKHLCKCGQTMRRRYSLFTIAILETGRQKVIDTLNTDNGRDFPGGNKHRKRYEQVVAKGLDISKPVVGIGF